MMKARMPYIHIVFHSNTQIESGDFDQLGVVFEHLDGYHALFAARVIPQAFESVEVRKWGWAAHDLLLEVMDRQRRFLASLHWVDPSKHRPNPILKTVSLRYLRQSDSDMIDLVLMGKVFAPTSERARSLAMHWWQELLALFPYDYDLVPAPSLETFRELSGFPLVESIGLEQVAGIRRYEMFIPKPGGQAVTEGDYVLFPFTWHPYAMEHVWRAMAMLPCQALISVTLRPTYLYEAEEAHLSQFYSTAKELAKSDHLPLQLQGELAARLYAGYINRLQHPYLMRVQIVVNGERMAPLVRAMGTALTHPSLTETELREERSPLGSGYYDVAIPNPDELPVVMDNLCLLELGEWGHDQAALPYRRFRYLFDSIGAHCAFRLPFPPRDGLPGVRFNAKPLTDN